MKPVKKPLTDGIITVSIKERISSDGKTIRQKRFIRSAKVKSPLSLSTFTHAPSSQMRRRTCPQPKLKNLHSPILSYVSQRE